MNIIKHQPEWVQQALKEGKYPFFVQMPVKTYHRQGITRIMGLGSAVERSRTGHRMSQKFIDKLKQVTTTSKKHLFINHDPNQIAGKVIGTQQGKSDEILPIAELLTPHENPIVDAPRAKVEHWINNKVELGMSFGGTATKVNVSKEIDGRLTYDILDGELMEWSITPINAVKRSDGSVKAIDECPNGICQQIVQQIENGPNLLEVEDLTMTDDTLKQSTGSTLNQTAYDYALQCIQDENVDLETPWNRGDYESYNINEHEDLTNSCLGINVTVRDDYQKYRYRVCLNGKLYKNAVIAVADNAPAGSDIYSAADELLKLIYQMEEPGEPTTVSQANMFRCTNCGQFNNQNTLTCVSCGSRLPNNLDGNNPIANQTSKIKGDDIMDDERLDKIEQTLDFVVKDIKERKEAEEKAKLEQAQQAEIQKALKEQEEKHKEEMEAFKQATKETTEELINDTLKQILGDKAGIIQQSRHPENQDPSNVTETETGKEPSTVEIDRDSEKTITEQAAEAMTVEQRYKSSVYAPPVVMGKVVEQGWTPDEFLQMAAKRTQG